MHLIDLIVVIFSSSFPPLFHVVDRLAFSRFVDSKYTVSIVTVCSPGMVVIE